MIRKLMEIWKGSFAEMQLKEILPLILLLTLLLSIQSLAQEDPRVLNYEINASSLEEFVEFDTTGSLLNVQIAGKTLRKSDYKKLKKALAFRRVQTLTFNNCNIGYSELVTIVKTALSGVLEELNLYHIKAKTVRSNYSDKWKSERLKRIRIISCELSDAVYMCIQFDNLPNVTHFSLINSGLNKNDLHILENMNLFGGLKHLDLSGNTLRDQIFTLFSMEAEGKLEVLKLNNCGIEAKSSNSIIVDLIKRPKDGEITLDFKAPVLTGLRHLELTNALQDTAKILAVYRSQFIQNLDVFEGPLYKVKRSDSEIRQNGNPYGSFVRIPSREERLKELEFYRKLMRIPMKSRRQNIDFNSYPLFKFFMESSMSERVENLIFSGTLWTTDALRKALTHPKLSKIIEVSLNGVNATQEELRSLIFDFPSIHFDIRLQVRKAKENSVLNSTIEFWPRIKL